MIEVNYIGVWKFGCWILWKVGVQVCVGEFVVFIGVNGVGKLILLKVVVGEVMLDEGVVSINSKILVDWLVVGLVKVWVVFS